MFGIMRRWLSQKKSSAQSTESKLLTLQSKPVIELLYPKTKVVITSVFNNAGEMTDFLRQAVFTLQGDEEYVEIKKLSLEKTSTLSYRWLINSRGFYLTEEEKQMLFVQALRFIEAYDNLKQADTHWDKRNYYLRIFSKLENEVNDMLNAWIR